MVQDDPDDELVAQVAALTYADPRSVRRELSGQRVAGRVGERIRVALAAVRNLGRDATAGTSAEDPQ